jgi:hypothetical protein
LIEYFANPLKQIIQYLNEGLRKGNRIDSNMFSKVIFDKNGVTKELIKRAKFDLEKELDDIDSISLELMKYHIWDLFEEIQEAFDSNSPCYHHLHSIYLEIILDEYSRFLKTILPSKYKIYRFFTDKEYAQRLKQGISLRVNSNITHLIGRENDFGFLALN